MYNCNMIMAIDEGGCIGKNNGLPWPHNFQDMLWFKQKTYDSVVIMGHNTWKSIGKQPLSRRINVVISKNIKDIEGKPNHRFNSLDNAVETLKNAYRDKNLFFIGGKMVYLQAIPYVEKCFLSIIKGNHDGDTYMDLHEIKSCFKTEEMIAQTDTVKFLILRK